MFFLWVCGTLAGQPKEPKGLDLRYTENFHGRPLSEDVSTHVFGGGFQGLLSFLQGVLNASPDLEGWQSTMNWWTYFLCISGSTST